MRSTLRSIAFGLVSVFAAGAMAQYPYGLQLNGTIDGCYAGQTVNVQTVQGTQPMYNFNVLVDPNTCTWSAYLGLNSQVCWYQVSTPCSGQIATVSDSVWLALGDTIVALMTFDCALNNNYDCLGILNGPNVPGYLCDGYNSDSSAYVGAWTVDCVCLDTNQTGTDCLGVLNGTALPGTLCVWNNQPGVWSAGCICVPDSGNVFDCLGVVSGPNMPGTYCVNFFGDTGVWSANCVCETNSGTFDCLGVLNGQNVPGTYCISFSGDTGVWSVNCVCDTISNYDCLGVYNGPAQPGTACTVPGTTLEGIWSDNCVCELSNVPCQADFWVLQAFGSDSVPVPYELWVWNLSSGGSGVFTYIWSFGDGTSSTDPYPTHTYSGNGPYVLCLSIADNSGCTSMHCDSISIDANGIYGGVLGGEGDRTDGFTINVQNPSANSVDELDANSDIVAWPNPTAGELNIAMTNNLSGAVGVTITDLNGRVVLNETRRLVNGKNQLRLSTENLGAGMYMVRIGNGTDNVSVRFVKAN